MEKTEVETSNKYANLEFVSRIGPSEIEAGTSAPSAHDANRWVT